MIMKSVVVPESGTVEWLGKEITVKSPESIVFVENVFFHGIETPSGPICKCWIEMTPKAKNLP